MAPPVDRSVLSTTGHHSAAAGAFLRDDDGWLQQLTLNADISKRFETNTCLSIQSVWRRLITGDGAGSRRQSSRPGNGAVDKTLTEPHQTGPPASAAAAPDAAAAAADAVIIAICCRSIFEASNRVLVSGQTPPRPACGTFSPKTGSTCDAGDNNTPSGWEAAVDWTTARLTVE
jgi:hypothetical protein